MSAVPRLTIAHLYPVEMSIYGDRGNVLTLRRRAQWRGIDVTVEEIGVGDPFDPAGADIIFAGGGQDRGQVVVGADLLARGARLSDAAAAGVVMLTVCGTYQLFGRRFCTLEGEEIPGIGVFGAETIGSTERLIGNVTVDSPWGRLVGFENHSGQTRLDGDQLSIGRVVRGAGNNATSGEEGAVRGNVFGTYLHGPMLPRNPAFADHLILAALRRKYDIDILDALDDSLENAAAAVVAAADR